MNCGLIINKDVDWTSRDVVNKLNKIFKTKKIGHTGTLDPNATGVMVCLIGKYTKLTEVLTSPNKEYIAVIKLGIKTDTLDIKGNVIETKEIPKLTINKVKEVIASFKGEYLQTVPLYSAIHKDGKRLYEYARNNEKVELPQNKVNIFNIELLEFNNNEIKFKCVVSKGTYIRSLAQSICDKLNVIGTLSALERIRQGKFSIDESYTIEEVENNNYKLLKIPDLLDVKVVKLNLELEKKVMNGNKINGNEEGYVLYTLEEKEIALYHFNNKEGKLILLIRDDIN